MTAVLLRVRSDLRARWRAWLGLTLIMGIAAGAVISSAAGARRTDTSYSRSVRSMRAPDAFVFQSTDPGFASITEAQLSTLPEVASTAPLVGYASTEPDLNLAAPADSRYGSLRAAPSSCPAERRCGPTR